MDKNKLEDNDDNPINSFAVWKRMMVYLRPYWFWAVIALVGVIGGNILQIAIPIILGNVIDRIDLINQGEVDNNNYILLAGALVVGLGVIRGLMGFMLRYFGERLSHHIAYDIRNAIYNKVQNLSFVYHDNAKVGTLITRAISDVNEIQRFFAFGLIDGLVTGTLFIGVSTIMIISNPILAALALAPMLPLAYFSRNFALFVGPAWGDIMNRLQKLSNRLQENAVGAEVVRAFAREDYEVERFSADNEMLYHEQLNLVKRWGTYLPMSSFIIAFSTALVLFFGGVLVENGTGGVTVGLVVTFNAYVLLLGMPMRFLGFVILLATQAISSAGRVFEILDEPVAIENKSDAITLDNMNGIVRFENVSFAYDDETPTVLHDVSFEVNPGEVVALVGSTGAGKSSLINLIPRFYDVTAGKITIDDVDVRDIDLLNLRKNVGIVLQTSLLFSATIRENIAYGKPDATEEQIIAASKAANAYDFILGFAEGYDTLIGERGVTLSGGQRQRIAIARALLINPRILILDDSTSSVDTKTEFEIRQALDVLMRGRTTFIIAQRLNSVQNADQILVIDDGRIIERGKHEELLTLDGNYAETYRLQLEDQERVRNELIKYGQMPQAKQKSHKFDKRATEEFKAIMEQSGGD